jgi:hypothetical protein
LELPTKATTPSTRGEPVCKPRSRNLKKYDK